MSVSDESAGSYPKPQSVPMTFKEPKELIKTLIALGMAPLPVVDIWEKVWELDENTVIQRIATETAEDVRGLPIDRAEVIIQERIDMCVSGATESLRSENEKLRKANEKLRKALAT